MTKLLHTADWQLGMAAKHAGEKAREVRARRLETADRIAALAHEERVDLVVLAGDTFEHHDVDDATLRRAVQALDRMAPIPVLVLPGNHDPLVPGGVWDRPSWRAAGPHVRLLRTAEELEVAGAKIYPCPLRQKRSGLDPTAWIPPRETDAPRIGIAHGALDLLPEKANFPIAQDRADRAGLDYLALGDWHGQLTAGRAAYSGTPEPTSYSEKDPGFVLVVTTNPLAIVRRRVASLTWTALEPRIEDVTDVEALEALPTENHLLRIAARLANPELRSRVAALEARLREKAFHLEWSLEEDPLTPSEGPSRWIPEGVLAESDRALAAILEGRIPEGPGKEFAAEDREVVRAARALLERLSRGEDG